MPIHGPVFALDLGITSGFADGVPGEVPDSGAVILKRPSEDRSVAFSNMIWFLDTRWRARKPAIVVTERRFTMQAMREGESGPRAGDPVMAMHAGLHAIVEGMCVRFGIGWRRDWDVAESTVRKHFTGKGRWGGRDQAKAATIRRCWALGLMPKESSDDNRADAIAVWDWACATFARRALSAERGVLMAGAQDRVTPR